MIVACCSIKGSPGVSSWSQLMGAAWPSDPDTDRVVVDADPAGGVMAARYGLPIAPGVASMVAGVRRLPPGELFDIDEFASHVGDGCWLVPGEPSGEPASRPWASRDVVSSVAAVLAADRRIWIVDVGRVERSWLWPLIDIAAAAVIFTRPEREHLVQVPALVRRLHTESTPAVAAVVGSAEYSRRELFEFFGTSDALDQPARTVVKLPAKSVVELAGEAWSRPKARRSNEWRSAVALADVAAALVATDAERVADPDGIRDGR